jgi:hypothetical protein
MMFAGGDRIRDYRIVQADCGLVIRLAIASASSARHAHAAADAHPPADAHSEAEASVRAELNALFAQQDVVAPPIAFAPWQPEAAGDKCCRIRRVASSSSVSSKAIA